MSLIKANNLELIPDVAERIILSFKKRRSLLELLKQLSFRRVDMTSLQFSINHFFQLRCTEAVVWGSKEYDAMC